RLGSRHVMVVHGLEGLDEISVAGPTMIGEVKDGEVREYRVSPADFGMSVHDSAAIRVDGPEKSKAMLLDAIDGKPGAASDIVALNAGASIYTAGLAPSHADGVKKARAIMTGGAARKKLEQFVAFTKSA
ncbi:MAG: anthranilate phosphoribosyltransferase, partial [Betaproteobacteria bacterium]|nr:anthranilate phosphoribosyltransferase [Betaproteobacteria bacterium]